VLLESWVFTQSLIHKGFEMVLFKWVSEEEGEDYGGHFRSGLVLSEEQLLVQIVEEY
jgi:hypothetical protein